MELNKVLLIGNLTRDTEARFLPNGSQVTKFSLASNRRYTSNGEKKEEVLFIDVETWGRQAETCSQFLRKGSQVLVEGRLKMEQYQTKEGEKRTKFVVVAESIRFGAKPKDDAGSGSGDSDEHRRARDTRRPAGQQGDLPDGFGDDGGGMTHDDLPF